MSAQEARRIHQSGGDYLHRGEVIACGPGDKYLVMRCAECRHISPRIPRRAQPDADAMRIGVCHDCGGKLEHVNAEMSDKPLTGRCEMPVKVGDIVLYENRRDAALHPTRFPSLDLEDDALVVLLAEQHVLGVIEESVAA